MSDYRVRNWRHRRGTVTPAPAGAQALRFYFSNAVVAPIQVEDAPFTEGSFAHFALLTEKSALENLTNQTTPVFSEGADYSHFTYVSPALAAQTISGTVKCQIRANSLLGTLSPLLVIRVCLPDGSVRSTLLALGDYGPPTNYHTSLRNKAFADGDALDSVEAQDGDYLAVDIGHRSVVDTPRAQIQTGAASAVSDLPENETETGALVPWIEFSNAILMQA